MKILGRMVPYLLSMLIKRTDTVAYPKAPANVPDQFRGAIAFDAERCVGCKLCQRACPAGALTIERVACEDPEAKRFKAVMRLDKCIFCGLCVDSCNKDALRSTDRFELATGDKASLEVEI